MSERQIGLRFVVKSFVSANEEQKISLCLERIGYLLAIDLQLSRRSGHGCGQTHRAVHFLRCQPSAEKLGVAITSSQERLSGLTRLVFDQCRCCPLPISRVTASCPKPISRFCEASSVAQDPMWCAISCCSCEPKGINSICSPRAYLPQNRVKKSRPFHQGGHREEGKAGIGRKARTI